MGNYLYQLRQQISPLFEMNELDDLIFALTLDKGAFPGPTKDDTIRQLLTYLDRIGRLPDLIIYLRHERSHFAWSDPPTPTPTTQPPPALSRDFSLPHPRMNMHDEVECMEHILTNRDPKTRLITITGPSGSGKTWLINEYTKLCQQYNHSILPIDLKSEAGISVEQCLQDIVVAMGIGYFTHYNNFRLQGKPEPLTQPKAEEWQNNLTITFFQDLQQQPHLPRLIVLFDHFESKRGDQPFLRWLKNTLLPNLFSQQTLKLIIAGQDDLQYHRHQQYHQPFRLTGLSLECYYQFAEACNITIEPHMLNAFHELSQGFPKFFVDYVHGQLRGVQ